MNTLDAQKLFRISDVCYVKILPGGFHVNGEIHGDLYIESFDITYIRKYWKDGKLVCYALDCLKGKNNKSCGSCSRFKPDDLYNSPCQIRLRLSWMHKGERFCVELPNTSIKNYIRAHRLMMVQYRDIPIQLKLYVIPRHNGSWGEVRFEPCPIA